MELEIGMYVRTKDYGFIRIKDCYIEDGNLCITDYNNNGYGFQIEEFKKYKSSPNIIDLIEVGDYVNGIPVLHKEKNELVCGLLLRYKEENIENIVTKEQFESIKYKVGDKE